MRTIEEKKVIIALFMLLLSSVTYFFTTTNAQLQIIVAQDGSGNYTTISQAVQAAPNNSQNFIYINIKQGVYYENVVVDSFKTNIVFLGEGLENTIISANRSAHTYPTLQATAAVSVDGDGFVAKDITFINTAGPQAGQAVAFSSSADRTALYRCSIVGYQDTLLGVKNRQFYKNCNIYGTTDFIFGDAAMVLQSCNIFVRPSGSFITAQGRDLLTTNSAIVLQNCSIVADPNSSGLSGIAYLGRPWRQLYSRVMVMESYIGDVVKPIGWSYWNNNISSLDNVYYAEYDNVGPSSSIDARIKCKGCKYLIDPQDQNEAHYFTVGYFLQGSTWIPNTGIPFSPDF